MEAAMERWNELSPEDIRTETFICKIYNFSTCKGKKYSQIFCTNEDKWRVLVYPKGNYVEYLSAYLVVDGALRLPQGWSRLARFSITVVNQLDRSRSITKETIHMFDQKDSDWGFTSLIPLTVLNDQTNGYLVDDTCIIEAYVATPKAFTTLANETGSSTPVQLFGVELQMKAEPTLADSPVVKAEPFGSFLHSDNKANFRGFGLVKKAYIPLLEEVCSLRPSLVECLQGQSENYTQWAFKTLGRTLYLLKTTKPKDMTEESCRKLNKLWIMLHAFTFDVSWLKEPVQNALNMKNHVERARKMREELSSLDTQRKRLKSELAAVESNFEEAQREVADAENLLEGELGYGMGEPAS